LKKCTTGKKKTKWHLLTGTSERFKHADSAPEGSSWHIGKVAALVPEGWRGGCLVGWLKGVCQLPGYRVLHKKTAASCEG